MAQYAIAFDLDTVAMKKSGITRAQCTNIYQVEIPNALKSCGFTAHPQGSLYHTESEQNPINAIMQLQSALTGSAPRFCRFVRRVHVFRMEEWSDVTDLIAHRPAAGTPDGEEELAEQEDIDADDDAHIEACGDRENCQRCAQIEADRTAEIQLIEAEQHRREQVEAAGY
nr:hypothetical protein [Delftia acidovorans]